MSKLLGKYGFHPRVAVWEFTLRRNMSCRHCGSRAGKPRDNELSFAEARQLCRDLAELGSSLSGCEPTLRKDWPLIAETLVELGVTVGMTSNGSAWSDDTRTAKAVGLESVAFSLDESPEHLRRVPGHFQKVLEAIASCRRGGLRECGDHRDQAQPARAGAVPGAPRRQRRASLASADRHRHGEHGPCSGTRGRAGACSARICTFR